MAVNSAPLCCGAFSLTLGVELICLCHLLVTIGIIASISSVEPMSMGNIAISPSVQVLLAAWATAGIPVVVGAGVGVLYRVEAFLNTYFMYLAGTIGLELIWFVKFLVSGSVCSTLAPRDVQRLGTAFVCGLTDTFALFWGLIGIGLTAYFIFIIWSAKEEVRKGYWPELLRYKDSWKISADLVPEPPPAPVGSQVIGQYKGFLPSQTMQTTTMAPPSAGLPFYGSMATAGSLAGGLPRSVPPGQPQSFIPSPAWTPTSTMGMVR